MLEFIKGNIVNIQKENIVLENMGLGYSINMPTSSIIHYDKNMQLPINDVLVYVHMHIREDAIALFGFCSEYDRQIFRHLLSVNKVGPKAAVSIMSFLSTQELISAILSKDSARLSECQGIGAKTAQKIILELQDKLKNYEFLVSDVEAEPVGKESEEADTIEALIVLGYPASEAKRAVGVAVKNGYTKGRLLQAALKVL